MPKPNLASGMYKNDGDSEPDMGDVSDDDAPVDPKTQAASLIREAIEDGDDESLADALQSFYTLCNSKAENESPGHKGKPILSLHFGKG